MSTSTIQMHLPRRQTIRDPLLNPLRDPLLNNGEPPGIHDLGFQDVNNITTTSSTPCLVPSTSQQRIQALPVTTSSSASDNKINSSTVKYLNCLLKKSNERAPLEISERFNQNDKVLFSAAAIAFSTVPCVVLTIMWITTGILSPVLPMFLVFQGVAIYTLYHSIGALRTDKEKSQNLFIHDFQKDYPTHYPELKKGIIQLPYGHILKSDLEKVIESCDILASYPSEFWKNPSSYKYNPISNIDPSAVHPFDRRSATSLLLKRTVPRVKKMHEWEQKNDVDKFNFILGLISDIKKDITNLKGIKKKYIFEKYDALEELYIKCLIINDFFREIPNLNLKLIDEKKQFRIIKDWLDNVEFYNSNIDYIANRGGFNLDEFQMACESYHEQQMYITI